MKRFLTSKQLGLLRHILTFSGGWLVAKGYLDAEQLAAVVGGIISIAGAWLSVKAPEKQQ